MIKKVNPTKDKKQKTTSNGNLYSAYVFYKDIGITYFQGPRLEKLIEELMTFAELPDSTDVARFIVKLGMDLDDWDNLMRVRPELRDAYRIARLMIDSNVVKKKGVDAEMRLLHQISDRWKKVEEHEKALRSMQDQIIDIANKFNNMWNGGSLPIEGTQCSISSNEPNQPKND